MLLTQSHLQVLQDIHKFSKVQRYHGLLPEKHAILYDDGMLTYLEDLGLIEEGEIIARCGSRLKGYRLTDTAKKDLEKMGIDLEVEEKQVACENPDFDPDELTRDQLEILSDVYHFSRIKKYQGIMPKHEMEDYNKDDIRSLYDMGYVLYIKLKGSKLQHRKGYILSEFGKQLLKDFGIIGHTERV